MGWERVNVQVENSRTLSLVMPSTTGLMVALQYEYYAVVHRRPRIIPPLTKPNRRQEDAFDSLLFCPTMILYEYRYIIINEGESGVIIVAGAVASLLFVVISVMEVLLYA
jgi:hypothetical protein